MAVKSKVKTKPKVKATGKSKPASNKKTKTVAKKSGPAKKLAVASARKITPVVDKPMEVTRTINLSNQIRNPVKPATKKVAFGMGAPNANLYNFMKAPRLEYAFEVGDTVEVFCDHEKGRERVRGWIKGIVVQVDNKMVAVQFRSNVFLTDGWMVPDRILWYPLNSEHIRPVTTGRKATAKKVVIPDY